MTPYLRIQNLVGLEAHFVAFVVLLICFVFYKLLLKQISEKRHKSLQARFQNTFKYLVISLAFSVLEFTLTQFNILQYDTKSLAQYFLIGLLVISTIAVIKIAQIIVYLYLFLSHMSHGVPRLIANMFTFFFTILIVHLIASQLFEIHLSALLATSAVFSLVLGLALQDTLGNLFSGLSLQIESPFKIGDWIEVHSRDKQWLGQVQEINWRATFLMSFSDELIMIPNKTIAQSEIIIISQGNKNIRLSQVFRFSYDTDIKKAKAAIEIALAQVDGLMKEPPIRILITETNESYLTMKAFYSLVDFSMKYRIGDQIMAQVIEKLNAEGLKLQTSKIEIVSEK